VGFGALNVNTIKGLIIFTRLASILSQVNYYVLDSYNVW
jgi:hypothetical protein